MQIVDAQIHVWGSGLPSNLAHRQVTSFTTEEAVGLMDEGGVDAAVIHPPGWDPKSTRWPSRPCEISPAASPFPAPSPRNPRTGPAPSGSGGTRRACRAWASEFL